MNKVFAILMLLIFLMGTINTATAATMTAKKTSDTCFAITFNPDAKSLITFAMHDKATGKIIGDEKQETIKKKRVFSFCFVNTAATMVKVVCKIMPSLTPDMHTAPQTIVKYFYIQLKAGKIVSIT